MDVIDNSYSKLDYQINTKVLPSIFDDSFLTIAFLKGKRREERRGSHVGDLTHHHLET